MKKLVLISVAALALAGCAAQAQGVRLGVDAGVSIGPAAPAQYYAPGYYGQQQYGVQERRVIGGRVAPRRTIIEHPPGTANQYRCFADRRPSGGPGTATGWCD